MFICSECGREYEDDIAYRLNYDCRKCGDRLEEAKTCEICGEYHIEDELVGGMCESCIDEYRHNVDACMVVALEAPKEEIKINALLASLFDEKDIEAKLLEQIKKNNPHEDSSPFIDKDISWFAVKVSA